VMSLQALAKRSDRADETNSAFRDVIVSRDYARTDASRVRIVRGRSIAMRVGVWSQVIASVMRNASWGVCVMMNFSAPIRAQMNYPVWAPKAAVQPVNVSSPIPV
jgi:hypothetical protein